VTLLVLQCSVLHLRKLSVPPLIKKMVDALMFAQQAASLNHLQITTKYVESKLKATSPLQRSFLNTDVTVS